ncbi:CG42354, partial [Drosophila busckii]
KPAAEDTQAEDVSDGISIISDCESIGRISPHPFLRDHLNELSYKFEADHDLPKERVEAPHQLRARHQVKDVATDVPLLLEPQQTQQLIRHRLPVLMKNGLNAVFYVGAILAILAIVGRLRNPEWQVLGGEKATAALHQRVVDLELQNNLMRAEIDIMNKQMQYLSSLSQGQGHGQSEQRKHKTFKAWPGNGNIVDAVDITKEQLKRPYKCADGKYVEIAGMCLESVPQPESLADEIGKVVNDVLQQSQAFHNFEKLTEQLGTITGEGNSNNEHPSPSAPKTANPSKPGPIPVPAKERYKSDQFNSKERKRHSSNEHKRQHGSHEHNSKERGYNKKYADKSKEQRHQKHRHGHDDDDDDSASGEWHQRLMQQREQARQRQDQKRNNNNWYIERGGSREQRRSGETRR